MDIFGAIDGTGPGNNTQYRTEFASSFVNRISSSWHTPAKFYSRGPTASGHETLGLAQKIHAKVVEARLQAGNKDVRLFLSGYSRGGLAAILVCQRLQRQKIPVDGLFLFDAVDMALGVQGDIIPDNVKVCFHARRNPQSRSRSSWGNCGTRAQNPHGYHERMFLCTHGGVGGVPWTEADSTGYINEALTSATHPLVRAAGLGSPALLGPVLLNDAHQASSRTTITLAQDRKGSSEVERWMFAALAAMRQNATS